MLALPLPFLLQTTIAYLVSKAMHRTGGEKELTNLLNAINSQSDDLLSEEEYILANLVRSICCSVCAPATTDSTSHSHKSPQNPTKDVVYAKDYQIVVL